MYDTQNLRKELEKLISPSASGFPVVFAIEKKNADRYIVFSLQDLPETDNREQIELEINTVGPMSDIDTVEAVSDAIIRALDKSVTIVDDIAFYIYKNTRNRVDGSDGHTARYRCTFDLYLYERID